MHVCVCARKHYDHSGCYLKLSVHGESLKNVSFLYHLKNEAAEEEKKRKKQNIDTGLVFIECFQQDWVLYLQVVLVKKFVVLKNVLDSLQGIGLLYGLKMKMNHVMQRFVE